MYGASCGALPGRISRIGTVVDHLVGLGHRRIVHVTGGPGVIAADRRNGYLRAMRRHGFGETVAVIEGDFTEAGGAAAMRTLLDLHPDLDAVFAASDKMAAGALRVLSEAGRLVGPGLAGKDRSGPSNRRPSHQSG